MSFFFKSEKFASHTAASTTLSHEIADLEQQEELEGIINDLEEENIYLIEEYNRLQSQLSTKTNVITSSCHNDVPLKTTGTSRSSTLNYGHRNRYENYASSETMKSMTKSSRALSSSPTPPQTLGSVLYSNINGGSNGHGGSSMYLPSSNKLPNIFAPLNNNNTNGCKASATKLTSKDSQILNEARLLRQHENRLEARMKILENHNRLLDSQLKQLKGLLNVKLHFEN